MNVLEDKMLLYRVAKNYYIDGLSQVEIAKQVAVSRPQISRMINHALEIGIVKIEVFLPETIDLRQLSLELKKILQLNSISIMPISQNASTDNFFSFAASLLPNLLDRYKRIGIGWGHSLYETSIMLSYQGQVYERIFSPIVGCSGNDNPYLQTNSIIDRFAEKFRADACYLNIPAFSPASRLSDEIPNQLKKMDVIWGSLDAVVVGIGGRELTEQFYIKELSEDTYINSMKKNLVGDIAGNFFLSDGSILSLPNYHRASCSIDLLKQTSKVIAIARGIPKLEAIYFCAQSGAITDLITDANTASELLKKYK